MLNYFAIVFVMKTPRCVVVAKCAMGSFSYDGWEPCRPCPKGFYQGLLGQTACTVCTGNTTTPKNMSISSDNCTAQSMTYLFHT